MILRKHISIPAGSVAPIDVVTGWAPKSVLLQGAPTFMIPTGGVDCFGFADVAGNCAMLRWHTVCVPPGQASTGIDSDPTVAFGISEDYPPTAEVQGTITLGADRITITPKVPNTTTQPVNLILEIID